VNLYVCIQGNETVFFYFDFESPRWERFSELAHNKTTRRHRYNLFKKHGTSADIL